MKLIPRGKETVNPAGEFALERFVPYRLSVLSNSVSRSIARLYADRFGLTIPEWRVMAVLGRFGPQSANGVSQRTAMDKVRVSRAVSRLVGRNLASRRLDPRDRRRAVLQLTPEGRAMHDEIVPLARSREAELLDCLSPDERVHLDRIIETLQHRADVLDEE